MIFIRKFAEMELEELWEIWFGAETPGCFVSGRGKWDSYGNAINDYVEKRAAEIAPDRNDLQVEAALLYLHLRKEVKVSYRNI